MKSKDLADRLSRSGAKLAAAAGELEAIKKSSKLLKISERDELESLRGENNTLERQLSTVNRQLRKKEEGSAQNDAITSAPTAATTKPGDTIDHDSSSVSEGSASAAETLSNEAQVPTPTDVESADQTIALQQEEIANYKQRLQSVEEERTRLARLLDESQRDQQNMNEVVGTLCRLLCASRCSTSLSLPILLQPDSSDECANEPIVAQE